jgi:hypothetical protein
MKLKSIGFHTVVPVYGHVWQRILPNQMSDVSCVLETSRNRVKLTIKTPASYKGEVIYVPMSNVSYYMLANETTPKKADRK